MAANARSGRPPDPNALYPRAERAGAQVGWVNLPREGRDGPVPDWPLPEPELRELEVWAGLWRRPQAVEWERLGQNLEVALYVRVFVEAERPGAAATQRTIARQLQDTLGLSVPGLRTNRWRIGEANTPDNPPAAATGRTNPRGKARSRLKLLDGNEDDAG